MKLQTIREVQEAQGPVATIYLESRSPDEDAEKHLRLRWDALRRELDGEGATDEVLSALEDAIIVDDIGEVQADGRVLVANHHGVLLNTTWDAAVGTGDAAHLADEAQLGPYIREAARSVRLLVAIANQEGAVVRREVAVGERERSAGPEEAVDPETVESVRKPRGQALSHKQIQRRADEGTKQNARGVAEHLSSVAKQWHPDALVLAGEVQGRSAVRDELAHALADICHETEKGGADDPSAEEALTVALREVASQVAAERARQHRERFEEAKANGRTAEGSSAVATAADLGAVDTVLLGDGAPAADEGALLAACARTDAQAETMEGTVPDGVAAILRFELPQPDPNNAT